jgi:hypothetical protein
MEPQHRCWKFRIQERAITIEPDLARRCPAVDPDDHHLFVSLGCATENLAQAALANGLRVHARFDPTDPGAVAMSLDATQALASPLFRAISERQCTRLPTMAGHYRPRSFAGSNRRAPAMAFALSS